MSGSPGFMATQSIETVLFIYLSLLMTVFGVAETILQN